MNRDKRLTMRDLAATVFTYALRFGRNPTAWKQGEIIGSVYAWDEFCKREGLPLDGLPVNLLADDLKPPEVKP